MFYKVNLLYIYKTGEPQPYLFGENDDVERREKEEEES